MYNQQYSEEYYVNAKSNSVLDGMSIEISSM